MRILLVEDDRMIAEGVRKALRTDGFAVDWVQDGEAALTAVGGEPYDLCCSTSACRSATASMCSRACARAATRCRC